VHAEATSPASTARPATEAAGDRVALDPAAEQLMHVSSEVLAAKDVIRRQKRVIWSLVAALRSSQQQQAAMQDLLDAILEADAGG